MDLEILIITYNRAADLEQTLAAVHASPFAEFRVSVLDNASTDETPEVCARWAERFEHFRHVRHRVNVGGGPNFLRAVELSEASYTWVLADDDDLDFTDAPQVIEAVRARDVDVVALGAPAMEDWRGGRTTVGTLWDEGAQVFSAFTFLPSVIFRSDLFTPDLVAEGYLHIDIFFPNFPFVRSLLERDASVLVTEPRIVSRRGISVPGSHMYFFVRWVRNCRRLPDRDTAKRAIYGIEPSRRRWLSVLAQGIMLERAHAPERLWPELRELSWTLIGVQRLALLACAPLALGPRRGYARLQRWRHRHGDVPELLDGLEAR